MQRKRFFLPKKTSLTNANRKEEIIKDTSFLYFSILKQFFFSICYLRTICTKVTFYSFDSVTDIFNQVNFIFRTGLAVKASFRKKNTQTKSEKCKRKVQRSISAIHFKKFKQDIQIKKFPIRLALVGEFYQATELSIEQIVFVILN